MSNHSHKPRESKTVEHEPRASHAAPPAAAVAQAGLTPRKLVIILGLMALVFFGARNFAAARSQAADGDLGATLSGLTSPVVGGGGGGCCGGGGAPVEGSATAEGGVQKIAVDTSTGSFSPNVIKVKAGVPLEIAFSQSPGGCLSGVLFPDFNISEDLTAGPKTVKLPALEKGTYTFYCQMQMVSAQIVAE